nr:MAG: envelope protein VP39 [White spot syndrome virus]
MSSNGDEPAVTEAEIASVEAQLGAAHHDNSWITRKSDQLKYRLGTIAYSVAKNASIKYIEDQVRQEINSHLTNVMTFEHLYEDAFNPVICEAIFEKGIPVVMEKVYDVNRRIMEPREDFITEILKEERWRRYIPGFYHTSFSFKYNTIAFTDSSTSFSVPINDKHMLSITPPGAAQGDLIDLSLSFKIDSSAKTLTLEFNRKSTFAGIVNRPKSVVILSNLRNSDSSDNIGDYLKRNDPIYISHDTNGIINPSEDSASLITIHMPEIENASDDLYIDFNLFVF